MFQTCLSESSIERGVSLSLADIHSHALPTEYIRRPLKQELIYVESHLSSVGTKFYGELTQNLLKQADSPGSNNGTGFLQTLVALKLREVYERITKKQVEVKAPAVASAQ